MQIYHYSRETGEFIAASEARPDPLEEGRFLVPGCATEVAPPAPVANKIAVFNGTKWTLKADFRGVNYWLAHGDKHTVTAIGETVPEGAFLTEPEAPPPTPAEIEAAKVAIVQRHMDDAARALRYDDIATACTYADEPAVPKFQAEGQVFRAWRSEVWATCYAILDDVNAGLRDIPTDEELLAELPELVLPQ